MIGKIIQFQNPETEATFQVNACMKLFDLSFPLASYAEDKTLPLHTLLHFIYFIAQQFNIFLIMGGYNYYLSLFFFLHKYITDKLNASLI